VSPSSTHLAGHTGLASPLQFTQGWSGQPFVEVRCRNCGKLICKWEHSGLAALEVKCGRCGSLDVIRLSTG
jgi:ribosomal protein S27E